MSVTFNLMELTPEQLRLIARHYFDVSRALYDACDRLYSDCDDAGMVEGSDDCILLNFMTFVRLLNGRSDTQVKEFLRASRKLN